MKAESGPQAAVKEEGGGQQRVKQERPQQRQRVKQEVKEEGQQQQQHWQHVKEDEEWLVKEEGGTSPPPPQRQQGTQSEQQQQPAGAVAELLAAAQGQPGAEAAGLTPALVAAFSELMAARPPEWQAHKVRAAWPATSCSCLAWASPAAPPSHPLLLLSGLPSARRSGTCAGCWSGGSMAARGRCWTPRYA